MLDAPPLSADIIGRSSPSPIQYAFNSKSSPHAGGSARPQLVPAPDLDARFAALGSNTKDLAPSRALYLHMPFCRARCSFCTFFQHASQPELMAEYLKTFHQELQFKAALPWSQAAPFDAVYVGGGTPTDLSPEQIAQLGEAITQHFPLADDCELTLEGRLNRFDDEKYQAALSGGFNRFSFGVQSFDTQVRRAAKRLDAREYILERLQQLTASKRATIAIDLMYGLPHQNPQNWQQDLQDVVTSGVDGVDLYQLLNFPTANLSRKAHQQNFEAPLKTPEKALMYQHGHQFFNQLGWKQLSYCHWASSGRERSRYNSLAKAGAEILPIGAGAGGNLNGYSLMQIRDAKDYQAHCKSSFWPSTMLIKQADNAALKAMIVSACDHGQLQQAQLGEALFAHCRSVFQAWQAHGLGELSTTQFTLSCAGQFWSVNLANGLLSYLAQYPMQQQVA